MSLTEDQERRLISNLKKWVGSLDPVSRSVVGFVDDIAVLAKTLDFKDLSQEEFEQVRGTVFGSPANVHMLIICLRQT